MYKEPSVWQVIYNVGALGTGALVFIGSWIYCIFSYGFLFGLGLGWLPSIFVAIVAGFIWPGLWALIALLAWAIFA